MAVSITVDGQPLAGAIRIAGDGIKFATIGFVATGSGGQPWSIKTLDGLLPFDQSEGILDVNGAATVYLGPTREKGDADFKVVVGVQTKTATVRFY